MTDREKVIKALACCVSPVSKGFPYQSHIADEGCEAVECPYLGDCDQMLLDALELLKEQEYARCRNCQFRDFGENEVDSWDRCKLHKHNTSPDEYCSWFVEGR